MIFGAAPLGRKTLPPGKLFYKHLPVLLSACLCFSFWLSRWLKSAAPKCSRSRGPAQCRGCGTSGGRMASGMAVGLVGGMMGGGMAGQTLSLGGQPQSRLTRRLMQRLRAQWRLMKLRPQWRLMQLRPQWGLMQMRPQSRQMRLMQRRPQDRAAGVPADNRYSDCPSQLQRMPQNQQTFTSASHPRSIRPAFTLLKTAHRRSQGT